MCCARRSRLHRIQYYVIHRIVAVCASGKKEKNLRHISRKRTRRHRASERRGKQKHTEKRSPLNASDRLKKCWTQWKRCCCLLELSVLLFLCLHTLDARSLLLVFLFIVCLPCSPACVRQCCWHGARLRSRDLFFNIVLFFDILMIMMRQLFKSRHIHALVKRPRRTCIMITSHKLPQTIYIQFERIIRLLVHSLILSLAVSTGWRELERKECAPEKNSMLKYVASTTYLKNELPQWGSEKWRCAQKGTGSAYQPNTGDNSSRVVLVTNLHKIWRWQLAQTQNHLKSSETSIIPNTSQPARSTDMSCKLSLWNRRPHDIHNLVGKYSLLTSLLKRAGRCDDDWKRQRPAVSKQR